jgi:hypothetical protein
LNSITGLPNLDGSMCITYLLNKNLLWISLLGRMFLILFLIFLLVRD